MKKMVMMLAAALCSLFAVQSFGAVADTDIAKIGDTGYATLEAAIAAVQANDTIEVLKDCTLKYKQNPKYTCTIDLGGYTVTATANGISSGALNLFALSYTITLTVQNGVIYAAKETISGKPKFPVNMFINAGGEPQFNLKNLKVTVLNSSGKILGAMRQFYVENCEFCSEMGCPISTDVATYQKKRKLVMQLTQPTTVCSVKSVAENTMYSVRLPQLHNQ